MSRFPIRRRPSAGPSWPLVALVAVLASALAAGCGSDADTLTRPEVRRATLDGTWSGNGSLYQDMEWSLTQHGPADSITGEGYMDAPSFLDGFPAGPAPRYRIRGERRGLFIELRFNPLDDDALALDFRGLMRRAGDVTGEVFLRNQGARLDVINVSMRVEGPVEEGG